MDIGVCLERDLGSGSLWKCSVCVLTCVYISFDYTYRHNTIHKGDVEYIKGGFRELHMLSGGPRVGLVLLWVTSSKGFACRSESWWVLGGYWEGLLLISVLASMEGRLLTGWIT